MQKILYRIIKGRYKIIYGDLSFTIIEPDSSLISDSYEVYERTYDQAYANNSYTEQDLSEFLVNQDIWTPLDDKRVKEIEKSIENLKLAAYENFANKKMLIESKRKLHFQTQNLNQKLSKKHSYDHLSCHNIAETARMRWLISESVDHKDIDSQKLLDLYQSNLLNSEDIRSVSKSGLWKNMWGAADSCTAVFDRLAIDLTQDQLVLVSFSKMYDNVYEHPERPSEEIIDDDICLDGWFIFQKRKAEKEKTQRKADGISNDKIRNAQEVYLMANNSEEAERIHNMNPEYVKKIVKQRNELIEKNKEVKQGHFSDVKQDLNIQKTELLRQHLKGTRK